MAAEERAAKELFGGRRAEWFDLRRAKEKILASQQPFLERLAEPTLVSKIVDLMQRSS
jgi:predicted NUDIX family NTP pyrophosphohydrolase